MTKKCNPVIELAILATATFAAQPAEAVDAFEIQVYEGDINRPGHFGLEGHVNYTIDGHRLPSYPGEQPLNHVGHLTLEPAIGITEFLELGGYLQNSIDGDGRYRYAGVKLRAKFVLPERLTGNYFLGINLELSRVPRAIEEAAWANELRPFAGYGNDRWLLAFNPILTYSLSGPHKFKPDFEPAAKVGFNTQKGFMLGAEYYASLGALSGFSPVSQQTHLLFLAFDLAEAAQPSSSEEEIWEFNFGIGKGLTAETPQQWLVKAIVGYSF
jgi:hypothetical protein